MGFNGLSMQSRLAGWLYRTGQPPFAVLSPWQQVKHFFYLNLNIFGFFFMFYLAWHSNLVLIVQVFIAKSLHTTRMKMSYFEAW